MPLSSRFKLRSICYAVLLGSSAILAPEGFAQDNVGEESTVVYAADYFAEYSPVTAQDMLDRIPGLGSGGRSGGGPGGGGGGPPRGFAGGPSGPGGSGGSPASGGRGLGSGSGGNQILINGKRTAGKNNQTVGQLDRITASQVNYIEIIRGTSGELDVRGSGQVINVVLFEELSNTSFAYDTNITRYLDHEVKPGGSLSLSGQTGALSYVVNASATPGYDNNIAKENSRLGDYSRNDLIREDRIRKQDTYELSSNLDYQFSANSSARLNALYVENDNPTNLRRLTTNLRVTPNTVSEERESIPGEQDNWEIGGDYEYITGSGSRYKILFISNEANLAATRERFQVLADGSERKNLFLDTASTTKERIVRGSYTFDFTTGQDIEIGAERAQTILDSNLALGLASSAGTPSAAFGGLVPQFVANANSSVEEIRYEPFAIHNWTLNPRMSLESTLLYETSEISQSGDVTNKRDFDFVKPKVDFRFDMTPQMQFRGTIEKEVRQLTFADFVAANDDQDNDANTQAGNANLRQQWLWKYEVSSEYRLPNDTGVLNAALYYEDHHDVIERIDVSTSPTVLESANGNIGDGKMYGFRANASIRMRMINMPNLLLTQSLTVQDSKIRDPFLGIDRRFQFDPRGFNSMGFRHDLPQWRLNWGGMWMNRHDGNNKRYDIDDIELVAGDPRANLFVEYVDRRGITYRLDINDVHNTLGCRERQRFVGRISSGILEEIEDRCAGSGRSLAFKINGTF